MWAIALGAAAGLLAAWIVRDQGARLILDVLVGIFGALVGSYALGDFGVSLAGAELGAPLAALAGALAALFLVSLIK